MIEIVQQHHVEAVCQLIRQAIILSRVEDHQNDPQKPALWLENKTVGNFRRAALLRASWLSPVYGHHRYLGNAGLSIPEMAQ